MRYFYAISFLVILSFGGLVLAKPLGMRPDPEPERMNLIGGAMSDLWSSPYSNKNSPIRIYEFRFSAPFLNGNRWTTSLKAEIEGLSNGRADLLAGRRAVSVGSDLRGQSFGLNFHRDGDSGNSFSTSVSYDSSSDEPYQNDRDKWIESSASYRFSPSGDYQWVTGLQYSRNRGFYNDNVLPYLGVIYQPTPGFTAIFGFPFVSLQWTNPSAWTTNFTTTYTSAVIDARRPINAIQKIQVRAGYVSRSYLHVNRIDDDMRLFFEEKYMDVGVSTELSDNTTMYFALGRSIDRNFYEAKTIYEPLGARTNFSPDFYGRFYFRVLL